MPVDIKVYLRIVGGLTVCFLVVVERKEMSIPELLGSVHVLFRVELVEHAVGAAVITEFVFVAVPFPYFVLLVGSMPVVLLNQMSDYIPYKYNIFLGPTVTANTQ